MSPTIKHVDFEIPNWGEFTQGPQTWIAPDPYADAIIASSNLVIYHRLNETAGVSATNQTYPTIGHGTYHPNSAGTWNGGQLNQAALTQDSSAKSALFNGTNGYLRSAYTLPSTGSWTINLWARNDGQTSGGSNYRPIFVAPETGGAIGSLESGMGIYAFRFDSINVGFLQFHVGTNSARSPNPGFDDGLVHMITLVKDGSTIRSYYDGAAQTSFTTGSLNIALPIDMGGSPTDDSSGSRYFHGLISDFSVWTTALSASDISNYYGLGT